MNQQFEFSNGVRGRFHNANPVLLPAVHLEPDLLALLSTRAEAKGMSLGDLVNQLLKKDLELIALAG